MEPAARIEEGVPFAVFEPPDQEGRDLAPGVPDQEDAGPEDAGFRCPWSSLARGVRVRAQSASTEAGTERVLPSAAMGPALSGRAAFEFAPLRTGWNQRGITKSMPGAAPEGSAREMLLT